MPHTARLLIILPLLMSGYCLAGEPRIENPSFEADVYKNYPGVARVNGGKITGWQFTGNVGVNPVWAGAPKQTGPQRPFVDGGLTPHGKQVALMQNLCTLSQTLNGLEPGKQYVIRYFENARHMRQIEGAPRLVVSANGDVIVSEHDVRCVDNPNQFSLPYNLVESTPFVAPKSGSAKLVFKTTVDGGVTVLIDQVTIERL